MDRLISEQAVIDAVSEWLYDKTRKESIETVIKAIPSAEPKIVPIAEIKFDDDMLHEIVEEAVKNIEIEPKTGHWKEPSNPYDIDGTYYCYCDNCYGDAHEKTDFCPNCGIRMFEPQESEDEK